MEKDSVYILINSPLSIYKFHNVDTLYSPFSSYVNDGYLLGFISPNSQVVPIIQRYEWP